MSDQDLFSTFLELNEKFSNKGISVLLGGGFGLYLKQLHLMEKSVRTLIQAEAWPNPRSTSDLDFFFPLDVLISLKEMQAVRAVIDELKFEPISGSEYWRFVQPSNDVKIDVLTGPIGDNAKTKLHSDSRRARPRGDLKLHAHPVPEALELSDHNEQLLVVVPSATAKQKSVMIAIPSPFTYLMMKITAFGDQIDNADKNYGRHHALDVYRIAAMLTEAQFAATKNQFQENASSQYVRRVRQLVEECFMERQHIGIIRMREHQFFGPNMQLQEFMEALQELSGAS